MKKWNATCWLGQATCLTALCHAYPYILKHLQEEMKSAKDDTKTLAMNLYQQLTSYDNLVFIHFYPDLAERMKGVSKLLQEKNLSISDVGNRIIILCMQLEINYSEDLSLPGMLLGPDDCTDNVLTDLFGDNFQTSNILITNLLLYGLIILEMENMEQDLQNKKTVTRQVNAGHTTHGVDICSKYEELLSKKLREERVHDQNTEAVFEIHFHIGFN